MNGYAPYAGSLGVGADLTLNVALAPLSYAVSGTVRSGSTTGTVLPGATVSIGSKSTTSGSDGSFSIAGLGSGSYTVTVSKATYTTISASLSVTASITGLNLPLIPLAYQVSGAVTSGSGTGAMVPGATVTIGTKTAVTNSAGTYSITGLVPGVYPVSVAKTGYLSYTNGALNVNANLVLGVSLAPVTYTLSGTIRSGSGTGALVAGATVSVSGKTATSNSAGVFSINGIQAGTYAVSVAKTGFATFANPAYPVSGSQALNVNLVPVPVLSTKK